MKCLVELFVEFFKISLFVIGGGYAIIAVADTNLAKKGWTKEGELLDNLPIFQMIPGLIATHTAVYVGEKLAGVKGAIVSVIAVALPAVGCFLVISSCYHELPLTNPMMEGAFMGFRAAMTGIIGATIVRSWKRNLTDKFSYLVMIVALAAIGIANFNVALVLLVAALVGLGAKQGGKLSVSVVPLLLFLKYGALAFGGGFVIVPMYLQDFVGASAPYLNLTFEDFSNITALSQMTPGPIGVNAATFFGYQLAGPCGALVASAMLLLPGSLIAYVAFKSLARFNENKYVAAALKGLRPASVALMLVALMAFARATFVDVGGVILTVVVGVLAYWKRINLIALILSAGALGLLCKCKFIIAFSTVYLL